MNAMILIHYSFSVNLVLNLTPKNLNLILIKHVKKKIEFFFSVKMPNINKLIINYSFFLQKMYNYHNCACYAFSRF